MPANDAPLVTVVVPLFNQEQFVEQALKSVLEQGHSVTVEIIVVDDGSTDQSAVIVERIAANAGAGEIRLLRQANSGGPAQPRNAGIAAAKGEFIAFLDPDDYWLPGKLSRQLALMQAHVDAALSFTDAVLVDKEGLILSRYLQRVGYIDQARRWLDRVSPDEYQSLPGFYEFSSVQIAGPHTSGVIVRRSALFAEAEAFPVDLRVGEDLDLWFRLLSRHKALYIDVALHAYRQHEASLMHKASDAVAGAAAAHARNFERCRTRLTPLQQRAYRRRIAGLHASRAYQHRTAGQRTQALHEYARALQWWPTAVYLKGWLAACLPMAAAGHASASARDRRSPSGG